MSKKKNPFINKIKNKKIFNLNFLTTKTNIFVSITTLKLGKTIFLKTSRQLGYNGTERRTIKAAYNVLTKVINLFFEKYLRSSIYFIINFRGSNTQLHFKLLKYLVYSLKIQHILYICEKQFLTHNGCPLEIKKRTRPTRKNRYKKSY